MVSFICNKNCQYITRIIFLIFIIAITSYFFWLNNKDPIPTSPKKEGFTEDKTKTHEDMIKSIFADLYKREPNLKELQFYLEYASDKPTITKAQLMDIIESTSPEIAKHLEPTNKNPIISANDPEQVVIEAYSEILFRMPSPSELKKYTDMLKKDATFTKDRLVFILMSTEEYLRMEKTQTNEVYSNLPGGVTDRQITMTIEKIYSEVTGASYIDPDTLRFFKKKFLEVDLDQVKFKLFIERYVMWTGEDPVQKATTQPLNSGALDAGKTSSKTATTTTITGNTTKSSSTMDGASGIKPQVPNVTIDAASAPPSKTTPIATIEPLDDEESPLLDMNGLKGTYYNNSTIYNIYTVGDHDYMGVPNSGLIKELSKNQDATGNAAGNVVKNISCQKGLISSEAAENLKKTTQLSSFMDQRNREQLSSTCTRNRKFNELDEDEYAAMFYAQKFTKEDMVLDPTLRWSVPQRQPPICAPNTRCQVNPLSEQTALIGTPITEAMDTKWGSILPSLPPS